MRRVAKLACILFVLALALSHVVSLRLPVRAGSGPAGENGDANGDGVLDLSDPIYLLRYLFQEGPGPVACADSPSLAASMAALTAEVESLRAAVTALEAKPEHPALKYVTVEEQRVSETTTAPTVVFKGVNVMIRNMAAEEISDGTGNLILGPNECQLEPGSTSCLPVRRTGSHNLVIGGQHYYVGDYGFLLGRRHTLEVDYTGVIGWEGISSLVSGCLWIGPANRVLHPGQPGTDPDQGCE